MPNNASRINTRIHHLSQVGFGIAAVDGAAGQVDDDVRFVDVLLPIAECFAVPAGGRVFAAPRQDHDLVAEGLEMSFKDVSDLARAARD